MNADAIMKSFNPDAILEYRKEHFEGLSDIALIMETLRKLLRKIEFVDSGDTLSLNALKSELAKRVIR